MKYEALFNCYQSIKNGIATLDNKELLDLIKTESLGLAKYPSSARGLTPLSYSIFKSHYRLLSDTDFPEAIARQSLADLFAQIGEGRFNRIVFKNAPIDRNAFLRDFSELDKYFIEKKAILSEFNLRNELLDVLRKQISDSLGITHITKKNLTDGYAKSQYYVYKLDITTKEYRAITNVVYGLGFRSYSQLLSYAVYNHFFNKLNVN